MFIRWITYIVVGLILVLLNLIANTRFGWSIDLAWILVAAAAFAWPVEVAPIAALTFGLVIDGLSGSSGFYTVSYLAMAMLLVFARRIFFLEGFFPAWIAAVLGAEILWLFFWIFARGIQMIGGGARPGGLISPFILSTVLIFPFVFLIARAVLRNPPEKSKSKYFSSAKRSINRT
jgi:rod shape-determining protein MreD